MRVGAIERATSQRKRVVPLPGSQWVGPGQMPDDIYAAQLPDFTRSYQFADVGRRRVVAVSGSEGMLDPGLLNLSRMRRASSAVAASGLSQ